MAITTTGNSPKGLFPDQTFNPAGIIPEALFFRVGTNAGNIEGDAPAVRVPYIKEDVTAGFVPEGTLIPEPETDLDELVIHTQKLAILSRMSREAATNATAETLLSTSMARAVTVAADKAFLSNAAAPTGLLNTPGLVDAGAVTTNLDTITDAITGIEANGGRASSIILDPISWGYLSKLKTQDTSAQPLLGAPANATGRQLSGLPVFTSSQMPTGSGLVIDNSNVLTVAGNLMLAKTPEAFFQYDAIGYRVVLRLGWGVLRPDRLAKFTIPVTPAGK